MLEHDEKCHQRCEWLKPQPDPYLMYHTNDCEALGMFEDDDGFCRNKHEMVAGCSDFDVTSRECLECSINLDGSPFTYKPYYLPNGEQSCRITGCGQVNDTNWHRCEMCNDPLFKYRARKEGLCLPSCD